MTARRTRQRDWVVAGLLVLGACAFLVAAGAIELPRRLLASERIAALAPEIKSAATEFGIDPYLVAGVIAAESSGKRDAVSHVGALGLMQLRLDTARERAALLGERAPTEADLLRDARLNIRLGCAYLRYLVDRFGEADLRPVLIAYNAGPNKAKKWFEGAGGFEPWLAEQDALAPAQPGSVRYYAAKVLATAEDYRRRGLLEVEHS